MDGDVAVMIAVNGPDLVKRDQIARTEMLPIELDLG